MPRPPTRLAWWFRRILFAAIVALLPWVACPLSTSSLYMMYYTVHPLRYPPRDPARDPSRGLSMSITLEAGMFGRARHITIAIARPAPTQAEIDLPTLRWLSPAPLSGTAISPESATALLKSAHVPGDDALLHDLGVDLEMLLRRISSEGVAALTPEYAFDNPSAEPAVHGALALKPVMPSVAVSIGVGQTLQFIGIVVATMLSLVIILTGFLHPRERAPRTG